MPSKMRPPWRPSIVMEVDIGKLWERAGAGASCVDCERRDPNRLWLGEAARLVIERDVAVLQATAETAPAKTSKLRSLVKRALTGRALKLVTMTSSLQSA